MTDKKKELLWLAAAAAGVWLLEFAAMLGARALDTLPIPIKAPLFIFVQWIPLIAIAVIMKIRGESFREFLPPREKLGRQVLLGIAAGFVMSVVLMLIPFALGFKEYIYTNGTYRKLWVAVYYLASDVIGTAVAEETVFRGYFYSRLRRIGGEAAAIAVSSVMFGFYHIFGGDIAQVIFTAVIGLMFCLTRKYAKGFSLLSLILMHGVYDFMIPVWAGLF
ncbi:MAG: CPBP family intramembrane metalloprotease [Ruminococcus sp.]|nr:CPBP family intramembrane metalloprotease [Ruminococcus sp.]